MERALVSLVLIVAACGGSAKPVAEPSAPARPDEPSASAAASRPSRPTPAEIFAQAKAGLTACYEEGKKAAPKMSSGRATFHVAVDASGKTTCVVPSDDTGLTQEVENCMSDRLAELTYPGGTAWSSEVAVVAKEGALTLGDPDANDGPAFESVATHGVSNAVPVVASLMPQLNECLHEMGDTSGLRVVYVGARIDKDGSVRCAVATGATDLPEEVRACTAQVLAKASFGKPTGELGLVSIPVKVLGRKTVGSSAR